MPAGGGAAVRRWKHLSAMTQAEQEAILTRSVVDRARRQIGLFTTILLVVSAVIIALIIYTMTMEKLKQIATLKLIGAPDRTIVGMIVQQALALGVIGFCIGAVLIASDQGLSSRAASCWSPTMCWCSAASCSSSALWRAGLACAPRCKVDPATALGG